MTLVLSVLTHQYVAQISDRRLVWPDGRIADDRSNKSVLLCGHVNFSYTGIASIEDQPTHEWMMGAFGPPGIPLYDAIDRLRREATKAFSRIRRLPRLDRRHTFVGVGWTVSRSRPKEGLRPTVYVVSNFMDAYGREKKLPDAEFSTSTGKLKGNQRFHLVGAGQHGSPSDVQTLNGLVRLVSRRNRPEAMAAVLEQTMRRVAARNRRVGDNLMLAIIPKIAVPAYKIGARPSPTEASFVYLPSPTGPRFRAFTPGFLCGDLAIAEIGFQTRP